MSPNIDLRGTKQPKKTRHIKNLSKFRNRASVTLALTMPNTLIHPDIKLLLTDTPNLPVCHGIEL
jgi:hypothetical protein